MPTLIPSTTAAVVAPVLGPVAPEVVWGVSPLFDYKERRLVFNDSNELVLGNEATTLSQRITAILTTPRLRYPIYSDDPRFGSDFVELIGRPFSREILKSIAERFVRRAVSSVTDSRIEAVHDFQITVTGKSIVAQFKIRTITGLERQFEGKWSV